jgi:hypothetical protein
MTNVVDKEDFQLWSIKSRIETARAILNLRIRRKKACAAQDDFGKKAARTISVK